MLSILGVFLGHGNVLQVASSRLNLCFTFAEKKNIKVSDLWLSMDFSVYEYVLIICQHYSSLFLFMVILGR